MDRFFRIFTRVVFGMLVLGFVSLFIYFLMKVSFQTGAVSGLETNMLSEYMTYRIIDHPTAEQVAVVNRFLRYGAHLGLFFLLCYMLTYVCLFLFNGFLRVLGMGAVVAAGCFLSYYTEYKKQFIDGRHFDMDDVKLNCIGCILGIAFMLFTYVINAFLYRPKQRKYED